MDLSLLIGSALVLNKMKMRKKRKQRKVWLKNWLKKRSSHGHGELLRELNGEPDDYKNFLRMDEQLFQQLVALVSPFIIKQDTIMRKAISPADRLAVTLRFLATGNSFEDLKFSSRIAATTISEIVEETCDALCLSLKDYIKYEQYQKFATEEFVLRSGGVLCPQPGCGMGILIDEGCKKITCVHGCGYVFCRDCLQGFHIGECRTNDEASNSSSCFYNVDPTKASSARWDEASKIAIRVLTKPCPKCRTPTERDGGCMHMVCSRAGCEFHWCWVCQGPWTRECMGNHWFG